MSLDRGQIGRTWPDREIVVEAGALRAFAKATGATDPVYFDEAAARAAGYPGLPCPPTYVVSLDSLAPAETFWLEDLGAPLAKVLHGEQAFEYHGLIHAGERVRLSARITDIYDKRGGALEFIVRETEARVAGELRARSVTTLVVRHG